MTHRFSQFLMMALALVLAGCAKSNGLVEVRGKVYVGDKSETKGEGFVTFHPDSTKGNKSLEDAVGAIQPDGSFVLETRGQPGAAKGWYKVAVSLAEVMNPNNPYVTNWLMPDPQKYGDWQRSGISIEVVENPQPGQYDIRLPALKASP